MAQTAAVAVPPWFQPAMQELLAPIRAEIVELRTEITRVQVTLAQTRNHQLLDGKTMSFEIVPFTNGSMPPADLPALNSVAAIRSLNANQSMAYAAGYGLGHIGTVAARRKAIGRAIGCSVAV